MNYRHFVNKQFTCERCLETFIDDEEFNEADKLKEVVATFGPIPEGYQHAIVCEECWAFLKGTE